MIQRILSFIVVVLATFCIFVLFLLGATALFGTAQARPLNFVLCEHKTGKAMDESLTYSGIETVGPRVIRSENVWAVVHTAEDKCSIIMLNNGQVAVVGSYSEVYCRVYGGESCK